MLSTIPGLSSLSAEVIVWEIGINMSRFPTESHLTLPKNNESAGKHRSNRRKHEERSALAEKPPSSNAPGRPRAPREATSKAQYLRLRSRRGPKKAIGAVAASIHTAAYHMLKTAPSTRTSALANHFDNRAKVKQVPRLVNRLQNLGFAVQITPMAA
jgi:transposase